MSAGWPEPQSNTNPHHCLQREREEADAKKREFFAEMENNMRRNVAKGMLCSDIGIVGIGKRGDVQAAADEAAARVGEPKAFSVQQISGANAKEEDIPSRIVRTISTIDGAFAFTILPRLAPGPLELRPHNPLR